MTNMNPKEIMDAVGHLPDQENLAEEIFEPYGILNSEMAGIIMPAQVRSDS